MKKLLIISALFLIGCRTDNQKRSKLGSDSIQKIVLTENKLEVNNLKVDAVGQKLNINLFDQKNKQKEIIERWLLGYFKTGNLDGISVEEVNDTKNFLKIFKVHLSNNFPTSLNKNYSIIYFENSRLTFLIPIEFEKILRNDRVMIGGYKGVREFEFYRIYEFRDDNLQLILDTYTNCQYGLKVGYYGEECIQYTPHRLNSKQVNEDQINFEGLISYFCKEGADRDENMKKPRYTKSIKIIYKYFKIQNKWVLQGDANDLCW